MIGRRTLAVIASALIATATAALAVIHAQARVADEQAIRKEIERIFQAFIDKDRGMLAATHGKNWRGYLTDSRTVLKGRDGYMRGAIGDGPMAPKGQGQEH